MNRTAIFIPRFTRIVNMSHKGEFGSGAGQGGGAGGSIREAGGAFGRMEAAREEEYFYKKSRALLEKLKKGQGDQMEIHRKQILEHQEAIKRLEKHITDLGKSR